MFLHFFFFFFFFFNDTATTEIYTLSLHDALPILRTLSRMLNLIVPSVSYTNLRSEWYTKGNDEGREEDLFWERESHRSEEHTSELQSHLNLVCRLLLEKKKSVNRTTLSHTTRQTT